MGVVVVFAPVDKMVRVEIAVAQRRRRAWDAAHPREPHFPPVPASSRITT